MIQKHLMEGKNIFSEKLFEEMFCNNHCMFNNGKIF